MELLHKYTNGNTEVSLYSDGTKIREYSGVPFSDKPETMDIKITNYCGLGCEFCFESSTVKGKHGNIQNLLDMLKNAELPHGIELAFGGGNPLDHPELLHLLSECKKMGFICNLTINQGHLKSHSGIIKDVLESKFVSGIGISITSNNFKELQKLEHQHVIYHLIAGVNDVKILDKLIPLRENPKALVLGYKKFGFGIGYHSMKVEENIMDWYRRISQYFGKCTVSFDNLGIEQLNIKRFFTGDGWEKFYMGDDFTHSCYFDAVESAFAPTSRNVERFYTKDGWDLKKFWGERK